MQEKIEQLYYTWSDIGIDSIRAGFRIRAISRGISDMRDSFARSLDLYCYYSLPRGVNSDIDIRLAPISLSLLVSPEKKKILVHKVYTGKDMVGRYGAFFSHLLTDLPEDFSAENAIALWNSAFWQRSNEGLDRKTLLAQVDIQELQTYKAEQRNAELTRYKVQNVRNVSPMQSLIQTHLPPLLSAYLSRETIVAPKTVPEETSLQSSPRSLFSFFTKKSGEKKKEEIRQANELVERPKIYIVGSCYDIARLIAEMTNYLPEALLRDLTFSTYEYDLEEAKTDIVGVCRIGAPHPPEKEPVSAQEQEAYEEVRALYEKYKEEEGIIPFYEMLPERYYETAFVINCDNSPTIKAIPGGDFRGKSAENSQAIAQFVEDVTLCMTKPEFYWLFDRIRLLKQIYKKKDMKEFLEFYKVYRTRDNSPIESLIVSASVPCVEPAYQEELINLAIHTLDVRKNDVKDFVSRLVGKEGVKQYRAEIAAKAFHKASYILFITNMDRKPGGYLHETKEFKIALHMGYYILPEYLSKTDLLLCEDAFTDLVEYVPRFIYRYWYIYEKWMEIRCDSRGVSGKAEPGIPPLFPIAWDDLGNFIASELRLKRKMPLQWVLAVIQDLCEKHPTISDDEMNDLETNSRSALDQFQQQLLEEITNNYGSDEEGRGVTWRAPASPATRLMQAAGCTPGDASTLFVSKSPLQESEAFQTLVLLLGTLGKNGYIGKEPVSEKHA